MKSRIPGILPLPLDKVVDFPASKMFVKARLQIIEPGAGRSLPRNLALVLRARRRPQPGYSGHLDRGVEADRP